MAKGSGMIEPSMATMLGFLTTDARVAPAVLQRALRRVSDDTFNAITVDGECSTNDCVFAAGQRRHGRRHRSTTTTTALRRGAARGLPDASRIDIVRGGEGATKLVTVTVTGAASHDDARQAARTIANSPLVKTAIHGGDPNWGRLIAAAGRSGAAFDLDRAAVTIGAVVLFDGGVPLRRARAGRRPRSEDDEIDDRVDLGTGGIARRDHVDVRPVSAEYVRINAEYRT